MRRIRIIWLVLLMALLFGCKSAVVRWQEQYDLGVRYLSDGEYEEAIIAFNAAIEIDPMQAEAYLNLANAYIGMNDFGAAREILERGYELTQSEALKSKLEELDSGNIFDYWGNSRKWSSYDGEGNLKWYHIYAYDKKQTVSVTTYDAAGSQTGYWDGYRYNEEGNVLISMGCNVEDGLVVATVESVYDKQGRLIRSNHLELDGTLQGYSVHEFDNAGRQICIRDYNADGDLQTYHEYAFDRNQCVGETTYDADGSLLNRAEYRFDEQGKMTGRVTYGSDGDVLWEETTEH